MFQPRRVILTLVALLAMLCVHAEAYTVPCGGTIVLSANPQEGYHFVVWSDGWREPVRRVEVSEAMSLTAYFAPDPPPENPKFAPEVYPSIVEPGALITISGLPAGQYAELIFYDMDGHQVQQPVYSSGQAVIQTKAPPQSGFYLLRITGLFASESIRILVAPL